MNTDSTSLQANTLDSQTLAKFVVTDNLLKDKIILVTGAGDGIGRTASLAFAKAGATVVLLGRTIQKLEQVYDMIESNGGAQPAIYPMNFEGSNEHDYKEMKDVFENEFGQLDGILHNASLLGPRTPISNYSNDQWGTLFQVNVHAPFGVTKALLPLLEKAKSASILFTGSSVGYKGRAFWGAYAATKAAQENLMQTLAEELDGTGNIRTNSINPGALRTAMRAAAYPAEDPITLKEPEEIMNRYIYLMSDLSKAVNGQQFQAQAK